MCSKRWNDDWRFLMIMKRLFLACCLALSLPLAPLTAQQRPRPNILFLFADDFCYEALGYLGHTDIETPNLDRLAGRGTTFTHAYNMGSFSGGVCGYLPLTAVSWPY